MYIKRQLRKNTMSFVFEPNDQLTRDNIKEIIEILVTDIAKRMAERGISFTLSDAAREFLADKGFDPAYGARPLKRALQKYLEDPLAEEILRGQYAGDCNLIIGAGNDRLTFTFDDESTPNNEGHPEEVAKP